MQNGFFSLLYSQHNSTKVIAVKMYSKCKNQHKTLFLVLLVMINVGYNLSVTNACTVTDHKGFFPLVINDCFRFRLYRELKHGLVNESGLKMPSNEEINHNFSSQAHRK